MRKRKLLSLLALLMVAVTGAWADADVTWNSSNVSDIQFWGGAPDGWDSYTKEGITLRGNAENVDANWAIYRYGDGINFNMNASGGYTFTAPDGKKFTKIEMTIYSYDGWYGAASNNQLGSGWPPGLDAAMTVYSTNKVTWTGDATSTVDLLTDAGLSSFGGATVSSIDFYFEASPEPAEPSSYTVTLKDGTDDADKWTITPAEATTTGVAQGTQVEAKYTGWKLVKSVKAVKKVAPAAAEGHPLSASEVGEIVCSDGLAYAAADKDNLPTGVTAVAIVAYVGDAGSVDASSSTYKGLAIAMSNANGGSSCGWGDYFTSYNCVSKSNDIATAIGYKDGISSTITLTSDGHYHEAATAAASNNGTAAPTGTSGWFLPSMGQWNLIVQGLASKKAGSAVTTDISTSGNDTYTASNLNSIITDAGGTGFNGGYQSSTQYDSDDCWHMEISSGRASNYVFYAGDYVRSVLAF